MRNVLLVLGVALCQDAGVWGFGALPRISSWRSCTPQRPNSKTAISSRGSVISTRGTISFSPLNTANNLWDRFLEGQGVGGTPSPTATTVAKQKCPVLICPAQLSVPADYGSMIAAFKDRTLMRHRVNPAEFIRSRNDVPMAFTTESPPAQGQKSSRGFPAYCADLTRPGWIFGLLPSALSAEYFKGELVPAKTLQFYYEAIDRALEELKENHPGERVHVVGHSIGGWVARAWLAERCSPPDRDNVLSLTTLGTPNTGPREDAGGVWTAVDQTRGLLKNINARFPGAHVEGVRYTSVAGGALEGKFPGSVEEMLAFVSYLPLCGDGGARGDGIIPLEVATLDGSTVIELPTSKHSGFIPFPGRAVDLGEGFPWYGSPDLMGEWVGNLEEAERERGVGRRKSQSFAGGWPW